MSYYCLSFALSSIVPLPSQIQNDCANVLAPHFTSDALVIRALEYAFSQEHIMDFTRLRALGSLFSMLNQGVRNILQYNNTHHDFPMPVWPWKHGVLFAGQKCLLNTVFMLNFFLFILLKLELFCPYPMCFEHCIYSVLFRVL